MENLDLIAEKLEVRDLFEHIWTHPRWFHEIKQRQEHPGSYHKDTETIFLRGPHTFTPESYFESISAVNYPHFAECWKWIKPVVELMDKVAGCREFGRMLIVKLQPGGHIPSHVDSGAYAEHYSRFHLVLKSNEHCYLEVKHEEQHMNAGELWWFDHRVPHSAHNDGDSDRLHLIIDAVSKKYPVRG